MFKKYIIIASLLIPSLTIYFILVFALYIPSKTRYEPFNCTTSDRIVKPGTCKPSVIKKDLLNIPCFYLDTKTEDLVQFKPDYYPLLVITGTIVTCAILLSIIILIIT